MQQDFSSYLEKVQYPTDRRGLEREARARRAPREVLDGILGLPDRTYPDLREVRRAWAGDVEGSSQGPAAGQARRADAPTGGAEGAGELDAAGNERGAGGPDGTGGADAAAGQTSTRPTGTRPDGGGERGPDAPR